MACAQSSSIDLAHLRHSFDDLRDRHMNSFDGIKGGSLNPSEQTGLLLGYRGIISEVGIDPRELLPRGLRQRQPCAVEAGPGRFGRR
jgi:hypothetical protein